MSTYPLRSLVGWLQRLAYEYAIAARPQHTTLTAADIEPGRDVDRP